MFKGLFRRKSRPITNPREQLWIRYYTADVNQSDPQLSVFPKIAEAVLAVPVFHVDKGELNENLEEANDTFLPRVFRMKEAVSPEEDTLISAIFDDLENVSANEKVMSILAPFVFIYAFRYLQHFDKSWAEEIANGNITQEIGKFIPILGVMDKLPEKFQTDVKFLLSEVITLLTGLYEEESKLLNAGPGADFMRSVLSQLLKTDRIGTEDELPILMLYVTYYVEWSKKFTSNSTSVSELNICRDIIQALMKLDKEFTKSHIKEVTSKITQAGFNLLLISFTISLPKEDVFEHGMSFIKYMSYIGDIDVTCEKHLWDHPMISFIVFFIGWTIDRFPERTYEPLGELTKKELSYVADEIDLAQSGEFTTNNTFGEDAPQRNLVDVLERIDEVKEGYDDPVITDRFNHLMDGMIALCKFTNSWRFLVTVIEAVFDFEDNIVKKKIALTFENRANVCTAYLLQFWVRMMKKLDNELLERAITGAKFFQRILSLYVFTPELNLWTEGVDSDELKLYKSARKSIFGFMAKCFLESQKLKAWVLDSLASFIAKSTIQQADEVIEFLAALFRANPAIFLETIEGLDVLNSLSKHCLFLQKQHLFMMEKEVDEEFMRFVRQARCHIFKLFDLFTQDQAMLDHLLRRDVFVSMLFDLLLEPDVQKFALALLSCCFETGNTSTGIFTLMFEHMKTLYNMAPEHKNDQQWTDLIVELLATVRPHLWTNRHLLGYLDSYKWMLASAQLVWINDNLDQRVRIVNELLKCYRPIANESPYFRTQLSQLPMKTVCSSIEGQEFGIETIDLMLELVFEHDFSLENPPKVAEIANQKILTHIHRCTKHLHEHNIIFNYIARICIPSVSNKLKVFRSSLLTQCLKYIQSFESDRNCTKDEISSVNAVLNLFSTVSSSVFHWKTFFESISSMKPIKAGYRAWWTSQLVSTFTNILASISNDKTPSSFFHFHGKSSGLMLEPGLNCELFSSGFTFMTRFELGTVIGNPNTPSCLLWFETQGGQLLEVFLDTQRTLKIYYFRDSKRDKPVIFESSYIFGPNQWYNFVLSVDGKLITVYLNGIKIVCQSMKSAFKFTKVTSKSVIGNTADLDHPLKANMSCCYLFASPLSNEIVRLLNELPNDYVYSFAPSMRNLFQETQEKRFSQIFSGNLANKTIFCYNARMTIGSTTAANVVRNDLRYTASAGVCADVIPFSTTFCDVAYNIGGLKTFLPLFQQVDYKIMGEDNNDSISYMLALSGLFSQFCRCSSDIQTDFVEADGMKCIAHLFSKIKSSSFQNSVILQMADMYSRLEREEHKQVMMQDVWLNFSMWRVHNSNHQITLLDKFLIKPLLQHTEGNSLILPTVSSVAYFVLLVLDEPNEDVRSRLWKLIIEFSKIQLTDKDKELIFNAALVQRSNEILTHTLHLMTNKINGFHKILENHGFYSQFIPLLASKDEETRIFGLEYLIGIRNLECEGSIRDSKGGIRDAKGFEDALLSSIAAFCSLENTEAFWTETVKLFFDNGKHQSALLPFVCYISHFYNPEQVMDKFVNRLLRELNENTSAEIQAITHCQAWYFWLFYMLLQVNQPTVDFMAHNDEFSTLYAVLLTEVLRRENITEFQNALGFLYMLIVVKQWNVTVFIRNIMVKMTVLTRSFIRETTFIALFTEIVNFMFYITNCERFFSNLELNAKHDILPEVSVLDTINGNCDLNSMADVFIDPTYDKLKSMNFSARIDEDGKWQDEVLAVAIVDLIGEMKLKANLAMENKLKIIDITSFILGFLMRSNPNQIEHCCSVFDKLISIGSSQTFYLFFVQFYYACRCNENRPEYALFIKKHQSSLQQITKNLTPLVSAPEMVEIMRESIPAFYTLLNDYSSVVMQMMRSAMDGSAREIKDRLMRIRAPEVDEKICADFEKARIAHNQALQRQRSLCEKAYKRIFRELSTNGGPWCSSGQEQHWKVWQTCDGSYRRVLMKPNFKFDQHMEASFLRDESTTLAAQQKYERWLQDTKLDEPEQEKELYKDETMSSELAEMKVEFSTEAQMVTIIKLYKGNFFMDKRYICFSDEETSIQFDVTDVEMVLHRSYLHLDKGLEFFLKSKKSYFIYFPNGDRQKVIQNLKYLSLPNLKLLQTGPSKDFISQFTDKWLQGRLSNYAYLMYVNFLAGRSFNDLSQYPVFPWVLSDYTSETLDLDNPASFRDLSKPIGTLNAQRLAGIISNYEECPDDMPEKCFYRMHYSNAFYVLHWLVRVEPYTTLHIEVNDKKFDKPNRMFWSIPKSWEAVTSLNPDFRELIPEFFSLPDFLMNDNKFDLGINEDVPLRLNDVILPPWAKTAHEFIELHRRALESPYVSANLHSWIDLIFGFKQQGPAAIAAQNTFHQYCYQSAVTKDVIKDEFTLMVIQTQASNVGIIPRQIFNSKHPRKTYIAKLPVFRTEVKHLFTLANTPIHTFFAGSVMYIISSDRAIWSFTFPKNFRTGFTPQPMCIGSLAKFLILPPSSDKVYQSKSFAFIPESNKFVSSSCYDNSFTVFKLDISEMSYLATGSQKFSLISTLNYAGEGKLLASWRDSSLTLFDLTNSTTEPLYRATPHLTSLIDVDVSPRLGIIASLDKDRRCILSVLNTGKFVRTFRIEGEDPLHRLILFTAGHMTVIACAELPKTETTIHSFGLNTRKINEVKFDSRFTFCQKAELDCGVNGIAIALENGRFLFMSTPDLKILLDIQTHERISSIHALHQLRCFVLITESRKVCIVNID